MDDKILDLKNKIETSRKKHRNWKKIVTTLAAVVVFCTTYMLILPAITMEKDTICGKEEHTHDETCYVMTTIEQEQQLECTYESLGVHVHSSECKDEAENLICGYADYIVHEHTDICYDADHELKCELPEVKEHKHTDECYQVTEEIIEHVHDDSCYAIEAGEIICGQEESEEHTHTEECSEQVQTVVCGMEEGDVEKTVPSDPVLVCDQEDKVIHEHTIACYDTSSGQKVWTCGKLKVLKHEHTEACVKHSDVPEEEIEELICEKEEHTHDETCLPEETEENQGETVGEAVVENDETDSSEEGSVRPDSINAWAETTGQTKAPMMRSFALQSRAGISTYAEGDNEPLDMTEWIKDVTMYKHEDGSVTEIENGTVVYEGDLIQFKLDYTIDGQQLATMETGQPMNVISDTVIYKIPDTFQTVNGDSGNIYNSDDEIVGTFSIDSATNTIIMRYDNTFVQENAEGKQIKGYISFFSVVEKVYQGTDEQQKHNFNSTVDVNLNVHESQESKGDLSVRKAKASVEGNVIKYMLTVSSAEGTGGPVTLTDVMSNGLTYIRNTLSVTKNGSPVEYTVEENSNSLKLTLPEMGAEELYMITYSAEADINLLDAELEVSNTAKVESTDSQNKPLEHSVTVTHNFNILEKKGEPGENGKIDWTITINKSKLDISGWTLTDVLNGVEFNGPVDIYNSANVLIQRNVTLPYIFPDGSTDMYYVKYTTEHSLVDGITVTNEGKLEKNGITVGDQDGTSVGTPIEKVGQIEGGVQQDAEGTNWVPIKWTVTIDTSAGVIPAGYSLVDKLIPQETGVQQGYMTYDQLIAAYNSVNQALQSAINTYEDVLSLSDSKATVYEFNNQMSISDLLNNPDSYGNYEFGRFEFILAKDIPQHKIVTFSYISSGIFYNNTVNNSAFANRFNINNSYEVTAKVSYATTDLTASKRGIMSFDPYSAYGPQDWRSNYAEILNLEYKNLIDNYLAWIIEVDTPPGYTGTGDVTLYENMPEGIVLRRLDISEKSGERWIQDNVELGQTYIVGNSTEGKYTVKVTETGDLEIIIPEELIRAHSAWADALPENSEAREFHTLFIVYTQMTDLDWPRVDENSTITKKSFENNFTLVNSNGDTITFGKNIQNITRDDAEGHVIKGYSTDQNYITYQVLLNPEGRDFDPNSNTLDVNDTLVYESTEEKPLLLRLVTDSVMLYEYAGKDSSGNIQKGDAVEFSYIYNQEDVTDDNNVTTRTHTIDLIVPDGMPLVLEYRYRADGAKTQHSVANTCTLESNGQGVLDDNSSFEMDVVNSTAGADTAGVTIYKVDSENYGIHLPNAKFELFIWNEEENDYINATDPDGNTTFITDPDGEIVLDSLMVDSEFIAYNTAYKLVEKESPEGYYLLKDPYYFYVAHSDLERFPSSLPTGFKGKALEDNGQIFLPNEKSTTKLAIRKKWKDYNGNDITVNGDQVSEVSFKVYRRLKGSEDSAAYVGTYTVTPDENGFWETVITNLPKGIRNEENGMVTPYIYTIEEVSVSGYEVEYEYDDGDATTDDSNGIHSGTITMTNRETEGYELPETGGIGTTPYTVGGLLLMTVAALFLLLYKNKKHRKEGITSS
ncbi:MAG: Cna B-type domain-containing protein [Schaedlerella sp.]|nr:Cna B-type domain-containing protein [Schaedlerella sp.]